MIFRLQLISGLSIEVKVWVKVGSSDGNLRLVNYGDTLSKVLFEGFGGVGIEIEVVVLGFTWLLLSRSLNSGQTHGLNRAIHLSMGSLVIKLGTLGLMSHG